MKICPVCHSGAFDDAKVCYGCLHRFESDEGQPTVRPQHIQQTASVEQPISRPSAQSESRMAPAARTRPSNGQSQKAPLMQTHKISDAQPQELVIRIELPFSSKCESENRDPADLVSKMRVPVLNQAALGLSQAPMGATS